LDINMPLYTFLNKKTNEEYDEVMSYEALLNYLKQEHIQQVFKIKITRYSDAGGMKDQFTDWCKENNVKGKGDFKPYGKATKGMKEGKNGKKKN
tara:strand:- start:573 stop:854 length:282 start_codon:yes stop_codon:yes gene_type:complete